MADYAVLVQQLQSVITKPPTESKDRAFVLQKLRQAQYALESPLDTVSRLSYGPLGSHVLKTALDLKLFDIIAAAGSSSTTSISLVELADQTQSQPALLRRLLRFCVSSGLVDEPTPTHYLANNRTRTLANAGIQAGLSHRYHVQAPCWARLPEFLKSHDYSAIDNSAECPFQLAHDTQAPVFDWLKIRPALLEEFGQWMSVVRDVAPSWLDAFPVTRLIESSDSKLTSCTQSSLLPLPPSSPPPPTRSPIFVDVGGGVGHQCDELERRVSQLKGGIMLQDLPQTLENAMISTAQMTSYDFFKPQPVHGASFYYLKNVLHDWSDEEARRILQNQVPALVEGRSVILVDEVVLPEGGGGPIGGGSWAVELDLSLMACTAGRERTEVQWIDLFRSCGLKLVETIYYDFQTFSAVQVVQKI